MPGQVNQIQRLPGLTPSSSSPRQKAKKLLDELDYGCIITNVRRHTNSIVHIVPPPRDDPAMKKEVEKKLVSLGIVDDDFDLDHISNMMSLDATLRDSLEDCGLFAIAVSKSTATQLRDWIRNDLNRQQRRSEGGLAAARVPTHCQLNPQGVLHEYMAKPELQLVLLHPWQLLPHGLQLPRRRLQETDQPTYDMYMITDDGRLRATDDPANITGPEFPIEPQSTKRTGLDVINVWLLMLNAHSKFSFFKKNWSLDGMDADILELMELTEEIVTLMYAKPERRTDTTVSVGLGASSQNLAPKDFGKTRDGDENKRASDENKQLPKDNQTPETDQTSKNKQNKQTDQTPEPSPGPEPSSLTHHNLQGMTAATFQQLPTKQRMEVGMRWFCGYDKLEATYNEEFGRRSGESAYQSPDAVQKRSSGNWTS